MTPFWRYWTASAISQVGTSVTVVALPLTALLQLHAPPFQVGLVTGSTYVGWAVLGPPAGVICRFLPLRGVQITTDLVRAVAIATIPAAWALGVLTTGQLIAVALVISACSVLFDVSNSTFLPAIVPAEELNNRNSWVSGLSSTTQLAGPPGAGALIQVLGPAFALLIDGVSYIGSAVMLWTLPPRSQPPPDERIQLLRMIKAGWAFVVRQPIMRACLFDATASNFVSGAFLVLVPVYLVRDVGASPFILGVLLAAEGAGGLFGAALAPRITAAVGSARAALWGSVFSCGTVMLLPLTQGVLGLVLFGVGTVGFAGGAVLTSINTRTYRQIASPRELLSRVMATVRFVSWGVIPLGSFLAGGLAGALGTRLCLLLFCVLSWLSPLILALSPVRGLRELDPRMAAKAAA